LYKSAFTLIDRRFRIAWYTIGGYVCVWSITCFFFAIFQCRSVHYYWVEPYGNIGKCLSGVGHYIGAGMTNTFSDFALLVLPMPTVWSLQMPIKCKVALSGVFLLGGM